MALGAGTGVLPLPGGHADPAAIAQGTTDQATAAVGSAVSSLASAAPGGTGVQTATGASVPPPTGSSSATATAGARVDTPTAAAPAAAAPAKLPTVPNIATSAIPALPAVPSCVANLIPTGATVPDPAQLVAQLPACVLSLVTAHLPLDTIQSMIGSANLPVNVFTCLSSVLRSVPGFVGGNLSGLPQLLSACVPTGSAPGIRSIPAMGSTPGLRAGR
jgi:hypothetical protein